jgi:hypothetical protein
MMRLCTAVGSDADPTIADTGCEPFSGLMTGIEPPLILRRIPQAYATEPERYSAWCGEVNIGTVNHDPNATNDQKWSWSLTIIVQAMVRGEHHGRASDRAEAMQLLRRAFGGLPCVFL